MGPQTFEIINRWRAFPATTIFIVPEDKNILILNLFPLQIKPITSVPSM
jgi:hypothetical protein